MLTVFLAQRHQCKESLTHSNLTWYLIKFTYAMPNNSSTLQLLPHTFVSKCLPWYFWATSWVLLVNYQSKTKVWCLLWLNHGWVLLCNSYTMYPCYSYLEGLPTLIMNPFQLASVGSSYSCNNLNYNNRPWQVGALPDHIPVAWHVRVLSPFRL